ncbi:TetR/AcrR family transcriptional regulator [Xylanimonas ulmi]|uniref:TetR family transcriptional regulator n=1 Tax=Xylanimonas ulmi TaxID=228973 RepID=A0A4Q7LZT3_9MICO|nr:TetR/AcrR family transcriptional regulator [Xylanibacterium ulmi]RZS60534.1 TetR family transcriptional regulator [Xylanibacterium ulmi]
MTRTDGRTALLDAAERLFAEQGIPQVSDRKVADAAGHKNHSAVAYYFGSRDGLLRALLDRQTASFEEARERLFTQSDSLLGDVRSFVLPMTQTFAALPTPSWRARFLARTLGDANAAARGREVLESTPLTLKIGASLLSRMTHVDRAIAVGRARLMTRIMIDTCADVERAAEGGEDPRWEAVGQFLADAITGMLQAPSSQSSHYPAIDDPSGPTAASGR